MGYLPFASLDEITRDNLNLEINNLWSKEKTGLDNILFVTHNISEAILLSNKIIVLSKRPGIIKEIIEVKLPKTRKLDMKHTDYFVNLKKKIKGMIE